MYRNKYHAFICTSIILLLLSACSSGGGGGGGIPIPTYTIGGTVTGLVGSGLVLQNNSGDDLAISADGSFSFSTAIPDGGTYSISVRSQPASPNQTCTVTNGSGTVSGANITNISIACTTLTYTIGVSVTGLTGSGLVLQNNGGDNLAISADGNFTFTTPLVDGSSYAVTVLTQPDSPLQTCSINNGTGTVSGADIVNISVVCVLHYSIGGTVTGLSGTGLILQNNGGDDLAISGDGSFTFLTTIADGSSFTVTVFNQPASPTQTCMLSNHSGVVSGADVTTVTLTCSKVSPLYSSNGFGWNDYVQGDDIANATDTACNADTDTSCLHGGEIRVVELTGISSCTGITASDALGAFTWICDESTGTARVISTGLTDGYGLADLLDFATPAWKTNSLTVYQDASAIETTTPVNWWTNPVITNTSGGALDTAGTIYVVPGDTTAAYAIQADSVALVTAAGAIITGPASGPGSYVISAVGRDFLWLEGMTINAAGDEAGVYWHVVKHSVMRNITASHSDAGTYKSGVHLKSSAENALSQVSVSDNSNFGIVLDASYNNSLSTVLASGNGGGISLTTSYGNMLSNLTASDNANNGISLDSSYSNSFNGILASNNGYRGIILSGSTDNVLANVNASNNNAYGISLFSPRNTLLSVTASNNDDIGVYVAVGDNILSDITASNNPRQGIYNNSASNNIYSRVSVSNNGSYGIYIEGSSQIAFSSVAASNNQSGITLARSTNITIANITAGNNNRGIELYDAEENYFTGSLKVGANSMNCLVDSTATIINPGLDDDNNPSDQGNDAVHDGLCIQEGSSDFGTAVTGITLASSFVGKVTTNDT